MALDPATTAFTSVLLIVAGLVLALYGGGLLRILMVAIGALLGGAFGFLGGTLLGDPLFPLIFGIVGAVVGIVLFGFVVRLAVAFVAGVIAGAVALIVLGGSEAGPNIPFGTLAIAALAFLVAAFITFLLFKRVIWLVTALIGGLLVGISVNFLSVNLANLAVDVAFGIALVVGGFVFLLGAVRQARAGAD